MAVAHPMLSSQAKLDDKRCTQSWQRLEDTPQTDPTERMIEIQTRMLQVQAQSLLIQFHAMSMCDLQHRENLLRDQETKAQNLFAEFLKRHPTVTAHWHSEFNQVKNLGQPMDLSQFQTEKDRIILVKSELEAERKQLEIEKNEIRTRIATLSQQIDPEKDEEI